MRVLFGPAMSRSAQATVRVRVKWETMMRETWV